MSCTYTRICWPPAPKNSGAILSASPVGCCRPAGGLAAMARTCNGLNRSAPGTPFSLSPYSAPVAPWNTGPVGLARLTVICWGAGDAGAAGDAGGGGDAVAGEALAGASATDAVSETADANTIA